MDKVEQAFPQAHYQIGDDLWAINSGGTGHGERLARIEAKMEHVATREDLAKIEVLIERKESTMLRWLLGIMAVAGVSLVVALIRVFLD